MALFGAASCGTSLARCTIGSLARMRRNGHLLSWMLLLAFMTLYGRLSSAASTYSESQANIVLQWGNARALGVGPYATGEFFIPPTLSGVYEEGDDSSSTIPLNAASYLHSSNGAMYMVIATDTSGNNRFFVAGLASGSEQNRYPSPVEVTSMIPCEGTFCLQNETQILDFELLDGMLAFVLLPKNQPNIAALVTMKFMWDANLPPVPIGRNGPSNLFAPGVLVSWPLNAGKKANITCGPTYCVSLSTQCYFWGTVGSVAYPLTNIYDDGTRTGISPHPLVWVGALKDGFIVINTAGTVYAYGINSGDVFGLGNPSAVAAGESVHQFGNSKVTDLACGIEHCVFLLQNGLVGAWGSSSEGQSGNPPGYGSSVQFDAARTISGLTGIRSVGAIGSTSYALSSSQFYAWGTNMHRDFNLNNHVNSSNADCWFGMPTFIRNTHIPTPITGFPLGISLIRAPRISSMSGWEITNRAMSLPVFISQTAFDNLRRNHLGISPRSTTNLSGKDGLLMWGAGFGSTDLMTPKGLLFANRSASTRTAFAGFPRIVELPSDLNTANFSVATNVHCGFLHDSNSLYSWGIFRIGIVPSGVPSPGGDGSQLSTNSPFPVKVDHAYRFITIASAKELSCGVWVNNSANLAVECWALAFSIEHMLTNSVCSLHQLTCGFDHCAFVCASEQVYLSWTKFRPSPAPWLGHADPNEFSIAPINMSALGSTGVVKVALGKEFSIVLGTTGIYACGNNNYYVLGQEDTAIEYQFPTLLWTNTLSDVVAGLSHVLGLSLGQVFSWGDDSFGQLGRSDGMPWALGQVLLPHPVVSIAAVSTTSFAITDRGDLYAWGRNGYSNMFGGLLVGLGYSQIPRLISINESLRYDFRVTSIVSSAFSENVFAKGVFLGSGSYPPSEPALATLSRFGVSIDSSTEVGPNEHSPSSPILPASVYQFSPNLLDLRPGEAIQGGSHLEDIDTLWTDSSIYSNNMNLSPLRNRSSSLYHEKSFAPILVFSDPNRLVMGADNHDIGLVYVLSDGSAWVIGFGSTTSIPGSYSSVSCAIYFCVLESSTNELILLDYNLDEVSYFNNVSISNGRYTVPGYGAATTQTEFVLQPSFHFMTATNSSISLYNVTDQNATSIDVTGEFTGEAQVLVSGYDHFLVLSSNGKMFGYGSNQYGQLPSISGIATSFKQIFATGQMATAQIVNLAATIRTSFAMDIYGRVFAWGYIPSEGPNLLSNPTPEILSTAYGQAHIYNSPKLLSRLPPSSGIVGQKFRPYGKPDLPPLKQASQLFQLSYSNGNHVPVPSSPTLNAPIVFPPSSIPLPNLEPPGPACPPPPSTGNWACDPATGTLYLAGSLQLNPGDAFTITGPIVIVGDFSLPPGASFQIKLTSKIFSSSSSTGQKRSVNEVLGTAPTAATDEPMVTVSGCASVDSPISLDPDEQAVKEIKKGGEKGKTINVVESSCSQTPGKLLLEGGPDSQKGCRRYTAQQQESTSGGRTTISAIMVVNHDTCNHGWIIAVCVVAVVVLAVVIVVVLLATMPSLRSKILPYHGSN